MSDFIDAYMEYTAESEPPAIFHRWCCLTSISALLGRGFYLRHGHFRVFGNLYTMLIGEAGTRKSTSIKTIAKRVSESGYDNFAKTQEAGKQSFMLNLSGQREELETAQVKRKRTIDQQTAEELWGAEAVMPSEPREVFVAADEFNEFTGCANLDFYTTLGNMWDWDNENSYFTYSTKNAKDIRIFQPTVTILGGNTQENFAKAFPPEIIGQGFLSRMVLIYGEPSGRKYTFPPVPKQEDTSVILECLKSIREATYGAAEVSSDAYKLFDEIYTTWVPIDDVRFKSYSNRRLNMLFKLCLVCAAAKFSNVIDAECVVRANTYLSAAEESMPKALGEFGKSKNSDVANKIMAVLRNATSPIDVKTLFRHVHSDVEKVSQLGDILQNMQLADRVQHVKIASGAGWLPKHIKPKVPAHVDYTLLTQEERRFL